MRIAVTVQASGTHLLPIVLPAAKLAARSGHDVAIATGPSMTEPIERAGLTPLAIPSMRSIGEMMSHHSVPAEMGIDRSDEDDARTGAAPGKFASDFVAELTMRHATQFLGAFGEWKPDVVLRDSTELGGYLAAEYHGIPHAALDIAPMTPFGDQDQLAQLNRQRDQFDLPAIDDVWHPFRMLHAAVVPAAFYPEEFQLPSSRYYRPSRIEDENLPPLDAELARTVDTRPLVLVTLGANAPHFMPETTSLLELIVAVLGEHDVTAVVGTGVDPDAWRGSRPPNVYLRSYPPQRALMPKCDLHIGHAGFNGAREALAAGVPMVVLPLFGDHHGNAERLTAMGVASSLDFSTVTHEQLDAEVRRILSDDSGFTERARSLATHFESLPPLDEVVDDVAALAD